jgi:hypothetical protein
VSTIAERYLAARDEKNAADEALGLALEKSGLLDFAVDENDDMTWDGDTYDGSLELFVPKQRRVAELAAFVLTLGFDKVWIHQHTGSRPMSCCSDGGHHFICDRLRLIYEAQAQARLAGPVPL